MRTPALRHRSPLGLSLRGFLAFLEDVLHSPYGSLDETIGLRIVWTSFHVDEAIGATELLE